MRVISVRPEMVMSVGMRDRMRMDVAPVKMSEGVLGLFSVIREKKRLKPCSGIAQAHDFIGYNTHPST